MAWKPPGMNASTSGSPKRQVRSTKQAQKYMAAGRARPGRRIGSRVAAQAQGRFGEVGCGLWLWSSLDTRAVGHSACIGCPTCSQHITTLQ